jgi:thiol:disulfide interchange protein
MGETVKKLESKDELDSILEAQKSNNNNNLELVVLHFGAAWCEASQDMDSVIIQLSVDTPRAQFFQVPICALIHNSILSLFTFIMLL